MKSRGPCKAGPRYLLRLNWPPRRLAGGLITARCSRIFAIIVPLLYEPLTRLEQIGTYNMSKAQAKRPKLHGCPNCGQNGKLGELDLTPGAALGYFDKNGTWQFQDETKVFWDDQRPEHDPARFICLNCDTVFDLSGKTY